jgi:peroxiredoxin Q/BCP
VRDALGNLAVKGAAALGISPDAPAQQLKFDTKHELGFPLLSDPDHQVAEAYGVWGEKKMYGKTSMGIIRSSFLVDETGKVLQVWYKVSPRDTIPKAMLVLNGQ